MTSTTPAGKKLDTEHLDKAEQALVDVTDRAGTKHEADPKEHLHAPSDHETSHKWLRSLFPYNSLQEFENAWHLGNYVLDRETGKKSFEEMSIYVRVSNCNRVEMWSNFDANMISLGCIYCTMALSRRRHYIGSAPKLCSATKVSRWASSTTTRRAKTTSSPSLKALICRVHSTSSRYVFDRTTFAAADPGEGTGSNQVQKLQ